ncbi:hypothetical protein [Dehalococcoides mccartyi]|uniref:Uncharacterized protein n=1 Tax=Dehalococcoides mccartyi TaxID=61435 RepID=A0A142VAK5_9CHLR|nr:hypothetical protein [Dehalococcoides mccartyi]AMU86689.1 hypothetical protein Dm11a5_0863 [Dehalococcoides mccartyi]AQU05975.1 hypothetical protein B1777_04580 [Dehalococcoides mccartyi]AQU07420.1 hypothetical protein B1778_04395 [Dehalococcoides mccartyi]AQW62523.1 hypothetical protein B1779_04400 [Dehalococcoides mccartyi]
MEENTEIIYAKDVELGFNPALKVFGRDTVKSLNLRVLADKGWILIRFQDTLCDEFDKLYKQHVRL